MSDLTQRLFLILPPAPDLLTALDPVFGDPALACAWIRAQKQSDMADIDVADIKGLTSSVSALQRHEIAVLFDDPEHVAKTHADGVCVTAGPNGGLDALQRAIKSIKPQGIVGAGGLNSRHDAMMAGELDIDFVMFGEPCPNAIALPPGEVADRASWWAEIFTIPCVAWAGEVGAIAPLAATGCEFIALTLEEDAGPSGNRKVIENALSILKAAQP
jgi:thiamine-phosphate pyrophosphorylase